MKDPLKPDAGVIIRAASIIQHFDEYTRPGGHAFDLTSARSLLEMPDMQQWMSELDAMTLLPKKRG